MPVRVDLITDMASDVVLHWGVTKPGGIGSYMRGFRASSPGYEGLRP